MTRGTTLRALVSFAYGAVLISIIECYTLPWWGAVLVILAGLWLFLTALVAHGVAREAYRAGELDDLVRELVAWKTDHRTVIALSVATFATLALMWILSKLTGAIA
jgi:hypothetical protein